MLMRTHIPRPEAKSKACGPFREDQRSRTQLDGLVAHGGGANH